MRSATGKPGREDQAGRVSIHALLAECDSIFEPDSIKFYGFNPRTPCGVRPINIFFICNLVSIHALLAECDGTLSALNSDKTVSIHALLAECDVPVPGFQFNLDGFNPRTPCGVRLSSNPRWSSSWMFQSTHSLRSATEPASPASGHAVVSIHALLAECDR